MPLLLQTNTDEEVLEYLELIQEQSPADHIMVATLARSCAGKPSERFFQLAYWFANYDWYYQNRRQVVDTLREFYEPSYKIQAYEDECDQHYNRT